MTLTHRWTHSWQFYTQGMLQAAHWKKHMLLPILTLWSYAMPTHAKQHIADSAYMSHDDHIGYLTLPSCHILTHRKNSLLRVWKTSSKSLQQDTQTVWKESGFFFGAQSTMTVISVWKARTIRIYITPSMSKQYDCCCWCWINQMNH